MVMCQGCTYGMVIKRASTDVPIVHCRVLGLEVPPDITFCSRFMPGVPQGRSRTEDYFSGEFTLINGRQPARSEKDKGEGVYL